MVEADGRLCLSPLILHRSYGFSGNRVKCRFAKIMLRRDVKATAWTRLSGKIHNTHDEILTSHSRFWYLFRRQWSLKARDIFQVLVDAA